MPKVNVFDDRSHHRRWDDGLRERGEDPAPRDDEEPRDLRRAMIRWPMAQLLSGWDAERVERERFR